MKYTTEYSQIVCILLDMNIEHMTTKMFLEYFWPQAFISA